MSQIQQNKKISLFLSILTQIQDLNDKFFISLYNNNYLIKNINYIESSSLQKELHVNSKIHLDSKFKFKLKKRGQNNPAYFRSIFIKVCNGFFCAFIINVNFQKQNAKKCARRYKKNINISQKKQVSLIEIFYFFQFHISLEFISKDFTPKKQTKQIVELDLVSTVKKVHCETSKIYLFESSNVYKLDFLNSITLCNIYVKNAEQGKIVNLLSINSDLIKTKKKFKCRCSKSRCNAKYCDCFSHGQLCGVDCQCTGCMNQQPRINMQNFHENKGCRCSKSGCMKNYCQCFQKGQLCGQNCSCQNCQNCKHTLGDQQ